MTQKTNLNVNPYYDDFNKDDNYYKILFQPGRPIQARELTGLQSTLQNQVESFGNHIFKDGSMVIPGAITCDNEFTTIKVNSDHLGIDISVYLDAITTNNNGRGTRVRGLTSGVVGTLKGYLLPPEEGVTNITIFVKYSESGNDGETIQFLDGEILSLEENITYGNTSLNIGDTIITLVENNASSVGYAVGVSNGVYFIRGFFVDVPNTQIVLDPYNNEPSYRVGFDVLEEIITPDDEQKLNDNAKGFTNYAAPGADRLKISVRMSKKQLLDNTSDADFIELVRVDQGVIKKLENKSQYNLIKDYFAKRTFEESGNYAIDPFTVSVVNSLNDEIGNGGIFIENQKTEEGNIPNDDLACIKVSAGTAYIKGYDTTLVGTTVVDVEKPRSVKKIDSSLVPFTMGSLLKVNNVYGVPYINIGASASGPQTTQSNIIGLYNKRRDGYGTNGTLNAGQGTRIGDARVYWYGVSDALYTGNSTEWDLYLFDVQTYTTLYLAKSYSLSQVPLTSYVRGLSSGATGYLAEKPNTSTFSLTQTSGTFIVGEQVIINEDVEFKCGISDIIEYTVEDIKSVYQDASTISGLSVDFLADTVLYERTPPNFSITDKLSISDGNTARVANSRRFSGTTGIKTEAIIKYQTAGKADPNYNIITDISSDGNSITVAGVSTFVSGICTNTVDNGDSIGFYLMEPKITNLVSSGLYTKLPKSVIASVDLSASDLTISRQITGKTTDSNGQLTLTTSDVLSASAGISSVFFESFDAERYSVHYSNGQTDSLNSGKFQLNENGSSITLKGLTPSQGVTINVTLKKTNVSSKTKEFIRSKKVSITRTSIQSSTTTSGLTTSKYYGIRIEDRDICLNVPDVVKIRAVYESTNSSAPVLDKLTFVTGLALDSNAIIGEKIVGQTSRAVGQIVSKSSTEIEFVYLNQNDFFVGETINFKESSISVPVQSVTSGSYIDKTTNYILDKGHKEQYCDYSKIVRKDGVSIPSKQLLIIFDYYSISSATSGDIFTVNSYTKDRYGSDIPSVPSGLRCSDILDFRPRVSEFNPSTATQSPFSFSSRSYENNFRYVISPDETSLVGYSYYLPRVDLITINRFGEVEVIKGTPSDNPSSPILSDDAMELARIKYSAYLFNPQDYQIILKDNKRFTMRDIGKLEERIQNLEEVTSLSLLELKAESFQITNAVGDNRFKTGFIVSNFQDKSLSDRKHVDKFDTSKSESALIAPTQIRTIQLECALDPNIPESPDPDRTQNLLLLDQNIQKSGDCLTLKYESVEWIKQEYATTVVNVNPFNVLVYAGFITLNPPEDFWTTVDYIEDKNVKVVSTGAKWVQDPQTVKISEGVDQVKYKKGGGRSEKGVRNVPYQVFETSYTPRLTGPSREFDYIEDLKVSSIVSPHMRQKNIYFAANGLRAFTRHYLYLDNQQVDVIPQLCQIEMKQGSAPFKDLEDVIVQYEGKKIATLKIQRPRAKFSDAKRSEIILGLGSPAIGSEDYIFNPYDKSSLVPESYDANSNLINFDVRAISDNPEKYQGYIALNAKIIGKTSKAEATITKAELFSDTWGDIIGAFFIRNPNSNPPPAIKIPTGTTTVKITAVPPENLSGATEIFASEAIGTYHATGTITQIQEEKVSVRNPPKPKPKQSERHREEIKKKAPHRDPVAQTFRVDDDSDVFLTEIDLFFASKDTAHKVSIELRDTDGGGRPADTLVEDYAIVDILPEDVNIGEEKNILVVDNNIARYYSNPIPTKVKFKSPISLKAGKTYAIVILCPASDGYEVWTAVQKGKDVGNISQTKEVTLTAEQSAANSETDRIYSKQYLGGAFFKSQNGSLWTESNNQDLTFKLYKAKFVNSGTATFYNSDVNAYGANTENLKNNPIEGLPRKLKIPVGGTLNNAVVSGTKIGQGSSPSVTGIVENLGGGISAVSVLTGGFGYPTSGGPFTNIPLYSISGKGTGARATITVSALGVVTGVTITTPGDGYVDGEILGITPGSMGGGIGAQISVTSRDSTVDTIYVTNVQGENFTNTSSIVYYTNPSDESTRTSSGVSVDGESSLVDDRYSGNVFRVTQFSHAHHGENNRIEIRNVAPDREKVSLTAVFKTDDTTVSIADTRPFSKFEGITTSRGYAIIENEILEYNGIESISGGPAGTLTIINRQSQVDDSPISEHPETAFIQPYESNGVSLRRINTIHDVPATNYTYDYSNINNYFLEFDRSIHTDRSAGYSMLNFESQKGFGGNNAIASQNHQFSTIEPFFSYITPGKGTAINAQIRTISGTSADGSEVSFLDLGYQPIQLNSPNTFTTPRMVCSKVNEDARLSTLPKNKSLTIAIDFSTQNPNVSPILDLSTANVRLTRNLINRPILDYVLDSRSNGLNDDPHESMFVTQMISLAQPSTSLKVLVAANRQPDADFRVFYKLLKADSSDVAPSYVPFPGYDNLRDTNGDGFGDEVLDLSKSSGRADAFVNADIPDSYTDYQFTASNLPQFNAFSIKIVMSSTNESTPVKLRDFRCIALR